jgi:flavin reductase (DIM6/NTAB) family NADH-FMN oxidoreductase RutF
MNPIDRAQDSPLHSDGRRRLRPATLLSPVPVVLVGCRGTSEETSRPNLITIAWAGTVCSDPPMVSISVRKSRFSHAQILESSEFTINLVDTRLIRSADFCGVKSGKTVDKFAECGLTAIPTDTLRYAPAISESPLVLECRVTSCQTLGSHDLFLAEIMGVTVRPDLLADDGQLSLDRADLVGYCHGEYWTLGRCLGFFGYSVADEKVLKRRMKGKG